MKMDRDGVSRRGFLSRQLAAGAGLAVAGSAVGGAAPAKAAPPLTVHPELYPLPAFAPELDLRGKVAVITGASTGIGRAAGEALVRHGVHVIGTSRDVAGVAHRPAFGLLNLDVSDTNSIDAFVKNLRRRLGRAGHVDILINNAGRGIAGGPVPPARGERLYLERLQLGIRTDYTGHWTLTHKLLPLLPRRGYARVYFTVSIGAYTVATNGLQAIHAYIAMKRALLASVNAWRLTLDSANSNIGVLTVNPYVINTRWPDNIILTEKAPRGSALEQYVDAARRSCRQGAPAAVVGEAYRQLLSTHRPPVNVAAGSTEKPYAAGVGLVALDVLDENGKAAIRFA